MYIVLVMNYTKFVSVCVFVVLLQYCKCDYPCLCNYNEDTPVYSKADNSGIPLGSLYKYDCDTLLFDGNAIWATIAYHHKVAFVEKNSLTRVESCRGDVSELDKLLVPTTISTSILHVTTTMPTVTKQATKVPTSSAVTAVLASAPTSSQKLEEMCQEFIKTDASQNNGFVGQYGQFCYELVDTPTQWRTADWHCKLLATGNLVHILNQNEQDYIVRFLNNHTYVKAVWLGLTDADVNTVAVGNSTEGYWQWSSGAPYTYNNFGNEFASHTETQHKLNDCVVMKQGGEWSDLPCGVPIGLGFGFGESHPYICQYNISSSVPNVINVINEVVG